MGRQIVEARTCHGFEHCTNRLQREVIDRIDDPKNLLHKLLPPADEESESVLAKIDWYGDTYFNYLQIRRFLSEWDQLEQGAQSDDEKGLIVGVRHLAQRCRKDRALLRWIGD